MEEYLLVSNNHSNNIENGISFFGANRRIAKEEATDYLITNYMYEMGIKKEKYENIMEYIDQEKLADSLWIDYEFIEMINEYEMGDDWIEPYSFEDAIDCIDSTIKQYQLEIKDDLDVVCVLFSENECEQLVDVCVSLGDGEELNVGFPVTKEVALKIATIEKYKEFDLKSSIFWNENEMEDEHE